jgi:hypothetical protein
MQQLDGRRFRQGPDWKAKVAVLCLAVFQVALLQSSASTVPSDATPFGPNALGVNIHFTTPLPGEMEMLAQAGFRWVRMDFDWASTESEPGQYDFSKYDGLLSDLDPYRIRAVLILDYTNPLYDQNYSPYNEDGRTAFANWAAAAATHFAGRRVIWEMYNEPDLTWTQPSGADGSRAENYAKLALAVGRSLRAATPKEIYVGPALSYLMHLPFLEASLKMGLLDYWSGVTIHPYRQCPPETIETGMCVNGSAPKTTYAEIQSMIEKYLPPGKTVPLLSGEWGYSTYWGCCDEETTAKFLPRELLTNLANHVPLSIWYDWRDDPRDPSDPEQSHFGVVLRRYYPNRIPVFDPKPAYISAKTINTVLRGYCFDRRLKIGGREDFVLVFKNPDGDFLLAAWTKGRGHEVVVPAKSGQHFSDKSYNGEELQSLTAGRNGLAIRLTDGPRYLNLQ